MTTPDYTTEKPNNEIWKDIPDYEGCYQASNTGQIRSIDRVIVQINGIKKQIRGRILKPHKRKNSGYKHVALCTSGKPQTMTVHRLILETFRSKRPANLECRHLNGIHDDNRLINLAWGTHKENVCDSVEHGTYALANFASKPGIKNGNSKLNNQDVDVIRELLKVGTSQRRIAGFFNVCEETVGRIKRQQSWKHS